MPGGPIMKPLGHIHDARRRTNCGMASAGGSALLQQRQVKARCSSRDGYGDHAHEGPPVIRLLLVSGVADLLYNAIFLRRLPLRTAAPCGALGRIANSES